MLFFLISYWEFQHVKHYLSRTDTSRNIVQKLVNFRHFEDVPIRYPKQFLHYIEFICRRACEKKTNKQTNYTKTSCL